jgi:hypothetical protein
VEALSPAGPARARLDLSRSPLEMGQEHRSVRAVGGPGLPVPRRWTPRRDHERMVECALGRQTSSDSPTWSSGRPHSGFPFPFPLLHAWAARTQSSGLMSPSTPSTPS